VQNSLFSRSCFSNTERTCTFKKSKQHHGLNVMTLINFTFSCRHNEDMEKKMVQKHKEQRNKGSEREIKLKKCIHNKPLQVIIVTV
jgi:hypothetical protein